MRLYPTSNSISKIRGICNVLLVGYVSFFSVIQPLYGLPLQSDAEVIRELVKGLYAVGGTSMPSTVLEHPAVDGIGIRTTWKNLQPTETTYNWSIIDNELSRAAALGKKTYISIRAGDSTPAWVYTAGAQTFTFVDPNTYRATFCTDVVIPIPYDPVYLEKWEQFITALGVRYGTNQALSFVRITGVNALTAETVLPRRRGTAIPGCERISNDVQAWINEGYTATRIKNTILEISQFFKQAFPGKGLEMEVSEGGLPAINDSGVYDSALTTSLAEEVRTLVKRDLGPQFIASDHGLSAQVVDLKVADEAYDALVGYQMLWNVTGDTTYRMNQGQVGVPRDILKAALDQGIIQGATYIEVYAADMGNPEFAEILEDAHKKLLDIPRIFFVSAAQTTPTAVVVTWNSYEASDSSLQYGLTTAYEAGSLTDPSYSNHHTLALTGLIPGATYYYRVSSQTQSGQKSFSLGGTFMFTDIQPPQTPTNVRVF